MGLLNLFELAQLLFLNSLIILGDYTCNLARYRTWFNQRSFCKKRNFSYKYIWMKKIHKKFSSENQYQFKMCLNIIVVIKSNMHDS